MRDRQRGRIALVKQQGAHKGRKKTSRRNGRKIWLRGNAVYLGGFGIRLSGQLDILRLMTRGLERCRRGGGSS